MSGLPMRPKDLSLALLVIVVWGANFAVIKVGVVGVPPMLLAALRFVLAAFPALLFFKAPRVPLRWYLAYGLTISLGQFAFLFSAIHVGMPSGLASLVLQSQSFFTLLLASWWLREQWQAHQMAGLLLALAGLVLIGVAHGTLASGASLPLLGFGLTLLAALSWACGNIVTRLVSQYGPMNQLAFVVWASLVPPLPFLGLSLWLEGPEAIVQSLTHLTAGTLAAVAYLAGMATLLGYGIWTYLMSRYPTHRVAPFTLLVPLVGLSTGWLVFGEALGLLHWAGGALLMLGLLMNVFVQPLLQPWLKRWACKT